MRDETRDLLVTIAGGVIFILVSFLIVSSFLEVERDFEPLCLKKCNEAGMAYLSMKVVHVVCGCGLYCVCEGGDVPVCDYDMNPNCMMYFLGAPLIAVGIAVLMGLAHKRGEDEQR